jgi:hypothetical protein
MLAPRSVRVSASAPQLVQLNSSTANIVKSARDGREDLLAALSAHGLLTRRRAPDLVALVDRSAAFGVEAAVAHDRFV